MSGVALVTGASRGIGLAAAQALAAQGSAVAVNGIADDQELHDAVALIRDAGSTAIPAPFDVSDIAGHAGSLRGSKLSWVR